MSDLTQGQLAVLSAFYEFGDMTDVALATYVHHMSEVNMSSSGVRTRRSELARKGLVEPCGTRRMKSGRNAAVHRLTPAGRTLIFESMLADAVVGTFTGRLSVAQPNLSVV